MKILFIINHSVMYGANKSLLTMLSGLKEYYGIAPKVILAESGGLCNDLTKKSIPFEVIPHHLAVHPELKLTPIGITRYVYKLFFQMANNWMARKRLKITALDFQPDIIHTNIGPDNIGYAVAKDLKVPHVWHIREYQDLDFNMRPFPCMGYFKKQLCKQGNFPIAITKGIYQHFQMRENAKVIYNGVIEKSQELVRKNKKPYFLFVGRLEEAKGIKDLIVSFGMAGITDPKIELHLAGEGHPSYVSELHELIREYGIEAKVKFLGFRTDVLDLMSEAIALIVPSQNEGFGRITVEAMSQGCLVIGKNTAGTKEILEEDNLGILFDTTRDLAKILGDISSKGIDDHFPMMKRAKEIALIKYSQEQNSRQVYELYLNISNFKAAKR